MRVGELVALRWRYVHVLPDLSGAVINDRRGGRGGGGVAARALAADGKGPALKAARP
jgi:hypothetical protein